MSFLIRVYQKISWLLGKHPTCRYYPSCSHYARQVLEQHGWWRGLRLSAWRLLRCNPWSKGGYDPTPPAKN